MSSSSVSTGGKETGFHLLNTQHGCPPPPTSHHLLSRINNSNWFNLSLELCRERQSVIILNKRNNNSYNCVFQPTPWPGHFVSQTLVAHLAAFAAGEWAHQQRSTSLRGGDSGKHWSSRGGTEHPTMGYNDEFFFLPGQKIQDANFSNEEEKHKFIFSKCNLWSCHQTPSFLRVKKQKPRTFPWSWTSATPGPRIQKWDSFSEHGETKCEKIEFSKWDRCVTVKVHLGCSMMGQDAHEEGWYHGNRLVSWVTLAWKGQGRHLIKQRMGCRWCRGLVLGMQQTVSPLKHLLGLSMVFHSCTHWQVLSMRELPLNSHYEALSKSSLCYTGHTCLRKRGDGGREDQRKTPHTKWCPVCSPMPDITLREGRRVLLSVAPGFTHPWRPSQQISRVLLIFLFCLSQELAPLYWCLATRGYHFSRCPLAQLKGQLPVSHGTNSIIYKLYSVLQGLMWSRWSSNFLPSSENLELLILLSLLSRFWDYRRAPPCQLWILNFYLFGGENTRQKDSAAAPGNLYSLNVKSHRPIWIKDSFGPISWNCLWLLSGNKALGA